MSTPFYVSPEQVMKDKSDYARKGIARGRSVLTLAYADGILFVGENPSNALHKISEIYDRIAFAAVGKYNEFENLRLAGVRYADLRGYQYDRRDVTSRGLANAYAQTLGTIFTEAGKPYEVELVVAEVGETRRRGPAVPADLRRLGRRGARLRRHGRQQRAAGDLRPGTPRPDRRRWTSCCASASRPSPRPARTASRAPSAATTSRPPSSTATAPAGPSRAWSVHRLSRLMETPAP